MNHTNSTGPVKLSPASELRQVLSDHPTLMQHGFDRGEPIDPTNGNHLDEFIASVEWIGTHLEPAKTKRIGSYRTKHLLRNYVRNGLFIAAAIDCGFSFVVDGPNARLKAKYRRDSRLWPKGWC